MGSVQVNISFTTHKHMHTHTTPATRGDYSSDWISSVDAATTALKGDPGTCVPDQSTSTR